MVRFNNTTLWTNASENIWCSGYSSTFLSTEVARQNLIVFCIASIICCIVCVMLNGIYIYAVIKNTRLRRTVNLLYVLLTFCDLVCGLSLTPVYILWLIGFLKRDPRCHLIKIWTVLAYSFIIMSVSAIGLITVEIYLAVFKPFTYRTYTRKRTLSIILLVVWVPSVLFPILSVYVFNRVGIMRVASTCYALVVFVTMIVCQKRIYSYIQVNANRCSNHRRKAAKVALQILLVYGLCSVPAVIANIINRVFFDSLIIDTFVNKWCNFIVLSYSLWDTFIYGYRSSTVRKEVSRLLTCGHVAKTYVTSSSENRNSISVISPNL